MNFKIDEIIDIKINGVKINTEPIPINPKEKFPVKIDFDSSSFTVKNACINLGVLIKDFAECNSIEDTIDFCARFKEPCKIIGIKIPPDYCKNCNNNIRECWRNVIENEWYDM